MDLERLRREMKWDGPFLTMREAIALIPWTTAPGVRSNARQRARTRTRRRMNDEEVQGHEAGRHVP